MPLSLKILKLLDKKTKLYQTHVLYNMLYCITYIHVSIFKHTFCAPTVYPSINKKTSSHSSQFKLRAPIYVMKNMWKVNKSVSYWCNDITFSLVYIYIKIIHNKILSRYCCIAMLYTIHYTGTRKWCHVCSTFLPTSHMTIYIGLLVTSFNLFIM